MFRTYGDPQNPNQEVKTSEPFFSEEVYRQVVQKSVIACTDVVLTTADDVAIYLPWRRSTPAVGPWVIGGRILFNDSSLRHSAARCVKRETGLEIGLNRFEPLPATDFCAWTKAAQGDFGAKSLCTTFKLIVTEEEIAAMAANLDQNEYDRSFGIQRFTRERLVEESVHPRLIDLFGDIFPQQ